MRRAAAADGSDGCGRRRLLLTRPTGRRKPIPLRTGGPGRSGSETWRPVAGGVNRLSRCLATDNAVLLAGPLKCEAGKATELGDPPAPAGAAGLVLVGLGRQRADPGVCGLHERLAGDGVEGRQPEEVAGEGEAEDAADDQCRAQLGVVAGQ